MKCSPFFCTHTFSQLFTHQFGLTFYICHFCYGYINVSFCGGGGGCRKTPALYRKCNPSENWSRCTPSIWIVLDRGLVMWLWEAWDSHCKHHVRGVQVDPYSTEINLKNIPCLGVCSPSPCASTLILFLLCTRYLYICPSFSFKIFNPNSTKTLKDFCDFFVPASLTLRRKIK